MSKSETSGSKRILKVALAVVGPLVLLSFTVLPVLSTFQSSNSTYDQLPAERIQHEIEGYEEVLAREPENIFALQGLVRLYLEQGNFQAVIAPLSTLVELNPEDESAALMLARAKLQAQDAAGAVAEYRRLYEADPENQAVFGELINAEVRAGNGDEAVALVQAELEEDPDSSALQIQLAQVYAQMGRLDEAIELYDVVIARDETDFNPILNKALALIRTQDEDRRSEVDELLDRAIELAPDSQRPQVEQIAEQVQAFYAQQDAITVIESEGAMDGSTDDTVDDRGESTSVVGAESDTEEGVEINETIPNIDNPNVDDQNTPVPDNTTPEEATSNTTGSPGS